MGITGAKYGPFYPYLEKQAGQITNLLRPSLQLGLPGQSTDWPGSPPSSRVKKMQLLALNGLSKQKRPVE
jgi:hypothetical protein